MAIGFQEFLKQKTAGTDVRERHRDRDQWIETLARLNRQITSWLVEADPERLIEIIPYEIRRAESRLGMFDAPALKIRLNTDEVDVRPIGRYSIGPLSSRTMQAMLAIPGTDGPAAGRVDMTDGERTYILLRDGKPSPERWFAVDAREEVHLFDRERLEAILQDLWS